MVSVEEIVRAAGPQIDRIARDYERRLGSNLETVFRNEALPALRDAYIEVYDELAALVESLYPPRIKGQDGLSLVRQRSLFVSNLNRQIQAADTGGGQLNVSLKLTGESDAEGRATSPDSLNFYIEGVAGEFGFITPDHFKLRRPNSDARLGRIGRGFIISRRNYVRERWEEITRISFNEVRHPISGFRPFRKQFEAVPGKINFGTFVEKALRQTNIDLFGETGTI